MFPAIVDAVKGAFRSIKAGTGAETLSLGIREQKAGGVSFDAVNAGWYARNGYPGIYTLLSGGMPAWSGEPVSLETALNHSVVWACNRLISETQGATPLVMLQRKNGTKRLAEEMPMFNALRHAPNAEMSAMSFQETRTSHCALQGNGYAHIIRRSGTGTAIELRALDPGQVRVDREKTGQRRLVYIVKDGAYSAGNNETTFTLDPSKPQDILHIRGLGWDGLRGYSVITMARQSVGTALSAERHVARFYANGGRIPYLLKFDKKFASDADFDKFRNDWEKTYAEPNKVPILDGLGATYQQTGLNAVDSQMLETRLFDIHEIARWFRISPHLVGDLSRATFANIEQLALEFVKMTMQPWFTRWEQDLWRCVLTPEEKAAGFYFKHNANDLLKGDFLSRMQGYSIALQNGVFSDNEVRDQEDWNPFPGGDAHHIQLNMQTVPSDGKTPASQSSSLVRISE